MRRLLVGLVLVLAPFDGLIAQQPSATTQLNVIPVQGKVHLISGAGVNITVHVGKRMATAEGRLEDASGKLYAHASTTCIVLPG